MLLPMIGACLLSVGLGGDPSVTGMWLGGTLLFWTTLLPRLPSVKGAEIWVASHGLAAAAFWAAVTFRYADLRLIGGYTQQVATIRGLFASALMWAAGAAVVGWLLDRAARRAPRAMRRGLTVVLALETIVALVCLVAVRGEAPTPSQRLRELPVVGHMAEGETELSAPLRIVRMANGTLFAPGRASAGFDALAADQRDREHAEALFPPGEGAYHVCTQLYATTGPLDVRTFHFSDGLDVTLLTEAGALEAEDDIDFARGCSFDSRGVVWSISVNNVRHPVRTSPSVLAVAIAGLVVAGIQILVAIGLLLRHRRLRRAIEGVSDGDGRVTLVTGTVVDAAAPAGPVLVELAQSEVATYRDGAKPRARVLARESRASADAEMDLSTCIALVAAVGTLSVAVLPFLALIATRTVVPY